MNITGILNRIDKEMKFDVWYQVKSERQKQVIIQLMDSELLPDCEFNSDYTKFRKLELAYELFVFSKEGKKK